MNKPVRAIGLMSGTSMDGIDAALIETDGGDHVRRLAALTLPYSDDVRAGLRAAIEDAKGIRDRASRPGCLAEVERDLTERHVTAVEAVLAAQGLAARDIDVIGFHGHTVLHDVFPRETDANAGEAPTVGTAKPSRLTVQIGDGPHLAERTGVDVVYDLRAADTAAGGEGAPLAPIYHRALASGLPDRPVVFLNLGGVANLTWIGASGELIAFDTGPGNAMIDDWVSRNASKSHDEGGRLAAAGRVDGHALGRLLDNHYFAVLPPKSLDRNDFSPIPVAHLSPSDGAATLTAFTSRAVALARQHLPAPAKLWVVCGGGRHNRTLMSGLAEWMDAPVAPAEALGFDGDSVEAEAFAYLAVRSLRGLPITFPGTTGAPGPLSAGLLAHARRDA